MADETQRVYALVRSSEQELLDRWVDVASTALQGLMTRSELERACGDLLAALTPALDVAGLNIRSEAYASARALLAEMSRDRARRGFSPSETATEVFALKEALFAIADARGDTSETIVAVSRWVDALGLHTFELFASAREQVITEQAEQLLELSTPVVKMWDGIVAVPLIGTLDSARAQVVMEKLLQTLVDTGSTYAIIDITGVPAVDTQVAQHILKTVVAARLMGAECVISGIRPQIAQTIVALGIEFGDIATKATLADALVHALRAEGIEMIRRRS